MKLLRVHSYYLIVDWCICFLSTLRSRILKNVTHATPRRHPFYSARNRTTSLHITAPNNNAFLVGCWDLSCKQCLWTVTETLLTSYSHPADTSFLAFISLWRYRGSGGIGSPPHFYKQDSALFLRAARKRLRGGVPHSATRTPKWHAW